MVRPYALLLIPGDKNYQMLKRKVIIGRKGVTGEVDLEITASSYVSRHHLEIYWKRHSLKLKCKGKNGIFINRSFYPYSSTYTSIPPRCTLRFPSTSICIKIQQCNHQMRGLVKNKHKLKIRSNSNLDSFHKEFSTSNIDTELDETASQVYSFNLNEQCSRTRRKQALVPNHSMKLDQSYASASVCADHDYCPDSQTNHKETNACVVDNISNTNSYSNPSMTTESFCSNSFVSAPNANAISLPPLICDVSNQITTVLDRGDCFTKPPYSYAQLISQAIASQPNSQLTLSGIYDFICKNYPYYRYADKGWQNSVRHNLSLNRHFFKVPRLQDEHGKGCFWRIDPLYQSKLLHMAFRKRRSKTFGSSILYPLDKNSVGNVINCTNLNNTTDNRILPYEIVRCSLSNESSNSRNTNRNVSQTLTNQINNIHGLSNISNTFRPVCSSIVRVLTDHDTKRINKFNNL